MEFASGTLCLPNGMETNNSHCLDFINPEESHIYYGWMNDKHQISRFTTCRGYIMDDINTFHKGQIRGVYWDKKYGDFCLDNACFCFGSGQGCIDNKIEKIADFVHKVEDQLKFEHTVFTKAENYKNNEIWMVKGDKRWIHSPFMISFYLFCFRSIGRFYHETDQTLYQTLAKFDEICDSVLEDKGKKAGYEYLKKIPVKYQDFADFKNAFPFLKKVLTYGIKPFFYENAADNFCLDGLHELGFASTSMNNKTVGDYGGKYEAYLEFVHRFKTDEEIENFLGIKRVRKAMIVQLTKVPDRLIRRTKKLNKVEAVV